MKQREDFQISAFKYFENQALHDLGLSYDKKPFTYKFVGFKHPFDLVQEVYHALHEHGILPDVGGWLDQTPEWRKDLEACRIMYMLAYDKHKEKKERT